MTDSNNTIILNGCINEYKKNNEMFFSESEVFELFTLTEISKRFELSYDVISSAIIDGGRDGGIDSFMILINDESIYSVDEIEEFNISSTTNITLFIVQSKTEKSFKESTLDKLISSIPELYNLELNEDGLLIRFNEALVEKIITFRAVWLAAVKKGSTIRIEYCYACKANDIQTSLAFDSKVDQIISLTKEKVSGAEVYYYNYSAKELINLYHKSKSTKLELQFKETPMSVTYENGHIGYLGVVSLNAYHSFLIDEDGILRENIFESNIRHYQGDVDVNQKIQETLGNDYERDFWWLNNGITIIASNVGQIEKFYH